MKKADVKVGAIVDAKSEEELKKQFQGKVEKIYENSALLAITSYDPVDATAISDLNNKIVVNFKNLKSARAPKNSKVASTNEVKIEKIAKDKIEKIAKDKKKTEAKSSKSKK
ncbi:DUF2187 family protein [Lactobacillus kefiranofaciens]|uniref:DUF2187 family protein n=1 Tax=Lactobacillus kefiranofaciens TaxID=267818 RepID=UPI0024687720|nr:DUF2187 family protein [Lactobacillus kefiranofaciens]MDH5101081.1 DUF2187 family protein [Lactobacillus kefiranofaciens]